MVVLAIVEAAFALVSAGVAVAKAVETISDEL